MPSERVASADWLHLEGVTLPPTVNRSAVRRLAAAASEEGTRVAFDLNGRTNQWESAAAYRTALGEVLPHCDLVFAGTDDLAVAGVDPTPAGLVDRFPADHSGTAFLTDGASATVGVGDGRFNTMDRLSNGTNGAGLFGGLSVQVVDRVNVMGMWYGQDLSLGLSAVVPGPIPVTITPAWVSVLDKHVFGDRVALSVGTSLRLP